MIMKDLNFVQRGEVDSYYNNNGNQINEFNNDVFFYYLLGDNSTLGKNFIDSNTKYKKGAIANYKKCISPSDSGRIDSTITVTNTT